MPVFYYLDSWPVSLYFSLLIKTNIPYKDLFMVIPDSCLGDVGEKGKNHTVFILFDCEFILSFEVGQKHWENSIPKRNQLLFWTLFIEIHSENILRLLFTWGFKSWLGHFLWKLRLRGYINHMKVWAGCWLLFFLIFSEPFFHYFRFLFLVVSQIGIKFLVVLFNCGYVINLLKLELFFIEFLWVSYFCSWFLGRFIQLCAWAFFLFRFRSFTDKIWTILLLRLLIHMNDRFLLLSLLPVSIV